MAKALEESAVAPNILQREFESYGPRAVLLTDITYLHYGIGQTMYMSTIEDAYTKEILAWEVSESLEVQFVIDTLKQLDGKHGDELSEAVLVHSDQGSHYKSYAYKDALTNKSLIQSMSRKGNCWDNQPMEYFFSGLKDHVRQRIAACTTPDEVRAEINRYMEYYNNERYQWKLAKLSPSEYYKFCVTGEYPLQIDNPPTPPVPEKTPEDLLRKAQEAAHKASGTGTESSDSTLDACTGGAVRAALDDVTRETKWWSGQGRFSTLPLNCYTLTVHRPIHRNCTMHGVTSVVVFKVRDNLCGCVRGTG